MLYLVVPTFSRIHIFEKFIRQIEYQKFKDFFLVVVDHGKNKTGYKAVNTHVIECDVNGWAFAINIGIRYVIEQSVNENDSILVINDDVIMDDNYLLNVIKSIKKKPKAFIGSVCYDYNTGKLLHVNMLLSKYRAAFMYHNNKGLISTLKDEFYLSDVLKGRGTILPISALKEIGLYNQDKLPHYRADHELAWRAKKNGYEVLVSRDMQLGAILDSPHKVNKKLGLIQNYKNIFFSMISIRNIKDLWNYSHCCFNTIYALYFFALNLIRDHIFFIKSYMKGNSMK